MGQGAVAPDGMTIDRPQTARMSWHQPEPFMEHIRQAVELAKASTGALAKPASAEA